MALQKWSPFTELERLRSDFDNMFNDMFNRLTGFNWGGGMTTFTPPIESYVEGDKLHIRADMPGVDPNDVEIKVANRMLTIRAKREQRQEQKAQGWLRRELTYGSFERTLELPAGVKADDIKASYRNGVMELTMPLPASAMGRKVPIESAHSEVKQIGSDGGAAAHAG
jgi:HSP20 family protein